MLQRIQTVWLFLATVSIFSLFLFPYVQLLNADGTAKAIKVTGVYENINQQIVQTEQFLALTIATVLLGLIPFLIVFFYKERKKQISLSYITILLIIGYSFWLVQTTKGFIGNTNLQFENYGIGIILPSVAILFLILAVRGIRHDERIIKSADRLR